MTRRSPFFALALLVPLLALAGASAVVLGFWLEGGAIAAVVAAVPLAAGLGAFVLRRRVGAGGAIVAGGAVIGYVIPAFVACASALHKPIVTSDWSCGTGEISLGVIVAFGSVLGSAGAGALAAGLSRLATRRAVEIGLRAFAAATITILLTAIAILATHERRESSSTFLGSLETTDLANVTTPMATLESWDGTEVEVHGAHFVVQHRLGEGVTTTDLAPPRGTARSCSLVVHRGAMEERHTVAYAYDGNEPCPELRVRYVPSFRDHDAFVIERKFKTTRPAWLPATVIDGATLQETELRPTDVPNLGPPHGWLAGVLVGGAIALLFFVASARASVVVRAGREGNHDGDGWIRFADGPPRFAPDLAGTLRGPVIVRGDARAPSYRTDGGAAHDAEILPGTLATQRAEALHKRAAYSCLAIATALLTLTPLVAAALAKTL